MPTLKLTDSFGFVDSVEINPKSALARYFAPLPSFFLADLNLKKMSDTPLNDVASLQASVDLGVRVRIGLSRSVDLEVHPKASAALAVVSGTTEKSAFLFDPDLYADPILVAPNQRSLSLTFNASVELDTDEQQGSLQVGFKAAAGFKLAYYQLFNVDPSSPTLAEALHATLANYSIAADLDDVQAMPAYSIASADGMGNLQFSATVNLTSLLNAPVSLSLALLPPLQISAAANLSVGASFELACEHQVRVQRLERQLFHLGVYRKKDTNFTVSASAHTGLNAGLGQNDLLGKILQAVSSDPKADSAALVDLPPARVDEIQTVVQQAVDRTLSLAIRAEIGLGSESEALFLYEIDLGAISSQGRTLVHAALQGDWRQLLATDAQPPAGITLLKTLISATKTLRHTLKVNLLGIYNCARISELVRTGSMAWDAASGELILTDTATASRIGVSVLNFAADSKKLRQLLSEQFLLSAAYTASSLTQAPPGLHAQHSYFDFSSHTPRQQLRNDLLLGVAFQTMSQETALAKLTAGIADFGESTVLAETFYDDAAAELLFLSLDRPRAQADYESAGRAAIRYLVNEGDEDDFRLLTATNDNLWNGMKKIGNVTSAEFSELIKTFTPAEGAPCVIGVDFRNIMWWTSAMSVCAKKLAEVRAFLKSSNVDPKGQEFMAMRKQLAADLAGVAAGTRQDFGGPWGLLATYLLATRAGGVVPTKLLITNQRVSVIHDGQVDR